MVHGELVYGQAAPAKQACLSDNPAKTPQTNRLWAYYD
ncbi:hypothetical protein NY78_3902 [Desulfovibrio sp. TomC]|nr:hypothetical protein NY78_3902 [Desulfovibrio sp. TomC]